MKTGYSSSSAVMPFDVGYSLRYRSAMLGRNEIETLAHPSFYGIGVYLMLKALDDKPQIQKEFLQKVAESIEGQEGYAKAAKIIRHFLGQYAIDDVSGMKIAQVTRMGADFLEEKFLEIASDLMAKRCLPVLVAYSATIGLKPFVENIRQESPLFVLMPKKIETEGLVGYSIKRGDSGIEVAEIAGGFQFDGMPVAVVDDTMNKGATLDKVVAFLESLQNGPRINEVRYIVKSSS